MIYSSTNFLEVPKFNRFAIWSSEVSPVKAEPLLGLEKVEVVSLDFTSIFLSASSRKLSSGFDPIPKDPASKFSGMPVILDAALIRLLSACCAPSGEIPKDPASKSSPDGILVSSAAAIPCSIAVGDKNSPVSGLIALPVSPSYVMSPTL